MDRIPDNMKNGGLNAHADSQIVAIYPERRKKTGGRHLWIWTAGGVALIATLAVIIGFIFAPAVPPTVSPAAAVSPTASPAEPDEEGGGGFPPLLYRDGNDIYLAAGNESIKLDSITSDKNYYFRGEVSGNGNTLYYLTNFNDIYQGDLMRIQLGRKDAQPERIAQGVASAQISPDGEKILYISGGDYGLDGDLYMCAPGGSPVQIDEFVTGLDYGFSADGNYVYYHTWNVYGDGYKQRLCLYANGETEIIYENDGEGLEVYVDGDGRAMIVSGEFGFIERPDYTISLCEDGAARRIVEHATFVQAVGRADEFLYVTQDNELIFYDRGNEQIIADKDCGLKINGSGFFRTAAEHFVFTEGGEDLSSSVLYEFTASGGKVRIANTNLRYYANADFSRVAYYKPDGLYMAAKADGQWQETKVVGSGSEPSFDDDGSYIYYCSSPDTWENNALYRMSLATGETEKLFVGVERFLLWNTECYAISVDGGVYRIKSENDSELMIEDVPEMEFMHLHPAGLIATRDGVYAFTYEGDSYPVFTDIYYISEDGSERICGDVEYITCAGLMPLVVY